MIFLQTHFFTVYSPLPPVGGVDPGILREPGFVPESHHLNSNGAAKVTRDGAIAFVVGWKMKNKLEIMHQMRIYKVGNLLRKELVVVSQGMSLE